MPRPKNPSPSYLLHRASGQARVRIRSGGRDQDVYLDEYGSPESLEEYHRILAEHSAPGGRSDQSSVGCCHARETDDWTIAELTVEYDNFASGHYQNDSNPTMSRVRARGRGQPRMTPPFRRS
jgi:hypothetical protein